MSKNQYIGYLKSQYQASSWQMKISAILLILATVPAAASIYIEEKTAVYVLTIANGVFLLFWVLSLFSYQKKRDAAHAARRAALLVDSFGEDLTSRERAALLDSFTVTQELAEKSCDANYYASSQVAGYMRLLDNIEESAFYTAKVQRASFTLLSWVLGAYTVIWLGIVFFAIPDAENGHLIDGARLFISLTVFILSGGLFNAWISYRSCSISAKEIQARCVAARMNGSPRIDVLMILLDYSGAIDSSPEALPFTYSVMRTKMEKIWATLSGAPSK
ncbi:hypothetical protein ACFP8Z_05445 [Gemmobacter lanyuensis]|uniref:hypothetical protein n=1 Tax=Gemmobacter lanyuensis TaxID=1054497 RepID=UPI001672A76D|nr:hypothetical protein [Gemmobacter lanyuensis]